MTKRRKPEKHKDHEEAQDQPKFCKVPVRHPGFGRSTCGGELNEQGLCKKSGGYPFYMERQPDVCPTCRKGLHWSGNCMDCWDTRTTVGPGYYFEEREGHWHNTGEKQRMMTKEENLACFAVLKDVLAGQSVDVGHERIAKIINPDVPF